jgi:hypothetical protein
MTIRCAAVCGVWAKASIYMVIGSAYIYGMSLENIPQVPMAAITGKSTCVSSGQVRPMAIGFIAISDWITVI